MFMIEILLSSKKKNERYQQTYNFNFYGPLP